ncbi:hypothetical protein G6F68_015735 [Rhizopus microsporus]|nr:hypothetical protein G6F68_015735 [Rhizopus microsporus]
MRGQFCLSRALGPWSIWDLGPGSGIIAENYGHPRRRHWPGNHGRHPVRARPAQDWPGVRGRRRRPGGPGKARRPDAGGDPGIDRAQQGGAEEPADHPGRWWLHLDQRQPAPPLRPVRQRASGAHLPEHQVAFRQRRPDHRS